MVSNTVRRDSPSETANAVEMNASTFVAMRIGRNIVKIDPDALRHLIDTLRTTLLCRS
jgi:hypothetical protein